MAERAPCTERLFSVDALKGFAISLVVLDHVLLRNIADPSANQLYLLLLSVEMPLFMFLSGFILPGRVRDPRQQWLWRRAVRLMVPFFAWHAIFFLSLRFASLTEQTPIGLAQGLLGYLATTISGPSVGLWYLPSLVLCSAALVLYHRFADRPLLLLAAGWITFLALGWARESMGLGPDFGLIKTITHWPFFAAGFTWGQWGRSLQPSRPQLAWAPAALYPLAAVPVMGLMRSMPEVGGTLAKVALGLVGVTAAVGLVGFAEPIARRLRLDELGRLTLGVYCAQWLFLRVEFGGSPLELLGGWVFVMAGSILLTLAVRRVPVAAGVLLGEWPRPRRPKSAASA